MRDPRLTEYAKKMRREPTEPEIKLWLKLRAKRLSGVKFRQQKVIGPYIADFASREPMIVIEIDGDTHDKMRDYDLKRTDYLKQQGYSVIRFTNLEIMQNFDGVLERLRGIIEISPLPTLSPEGERAL